MTDGVVFEVPAPVEMYDAVHAEVLRTLGASVDGLLLHVAHQTSDGFRVIEVWESAEQANRYNEKIDVIIGRLFPEQPQAGRPEPLEFAVRGLVIPAANVAV